VSSEDGFDTLSRLNPEFNGPSVAVPRTAFPLLLSRNETVPEGTDAPAPPTTAFSVKLPALPLAEIVVVGGYKPMTAKFIVPDVLAESPAPFNRVPPKIAL
jgi:hypothetical protein